MYSVVPVYTHIMFLFTCLVLFYSVSGKSFKILEKL